MKASFATHVLLWDKEQTPPVVLARIGGEARCYPHRKSGGGAWTAVRPGAREDNDAFRDALMTAHLCDMLEEGIDLEAIFTALRFNLEEYDRFIHRRNTIMGGGQYL